MEEEDDTPEPYEFAPVVSDKELREAGYCADAREFPLTEAAFEAKCAWNRVPSDLAPLTWRYAPNAWALRLWEAKAQDFAAQ